MREKFYIREVRPSFLMSDNFKHDEAYYLGVLVLPKDFDKALLKKAYRREAMKWHPDKNPDDAYAEERLKLVNEAYEFFSNQINKKSTEKREYMEDLELYEDELYEDWEKEGYSSSWDKSIDNLFDPLRNWFNKKQYEYDNKYK